MNDYADLSPAKYILLGREDIAATVICMSEAQQNKLELTDAIPLGQGAFGMASMESSSLSAFHTPHLLPLSASRSTILSVKSSRYSYSDIHKGVKHCMPVSWG